MTTDTSFTNYLAELRSRGASFSLVWISGEKAQQVVVEPWGSQLLLRPRREYAVVAEGAEGEESDGDSPNRRISIELKEILTIWPNGLDSNRVYRDDGHLVWDDARPSDVYEFIKQSSILTALRRLRRLNREGTSVEVAPFQEMLRAQSHTRPWRDDAVLLLAEHGIIDIDGGSVVVLTPWGKQFLDMRKPSPVPSNSDR